MNMTVTVEDFGPIGEGSVELRPLTVFVGPSNTGKSYLAILLYALHRHFSSGTWERYRLRPHREDKSLRADAIRELSEALKALLGTRERAATRRAVSDDVPTAVLPRPIAAWVRDTLAAGRPYLAAEIERCFGAPRGELVRKGSALARIGLMSRAGNGSGSDDFLVQDLTITEVGVELATSVPEGMSFRLPAEDLSSRIGRQQLGLFSVAESDDQLTWWGIRESLAAVGDCVIAKILGPLRLPAFYLPADRTGIMHAHRVVVSALIENATMAGLRRTGATPTLSGVLADFMRRLIEIDRRHPGRHRFHPELGQSIEQNILQGSVRIDQDATGYPSFRYRPTKWERDDLPLMRVSSMVAELAPLVLYLRHVVATDNVLIVEEPESHLHPAMQVELVGQLAKLVKAGIRVLVTTHSEWVLDELANLVNLSRLPEEERSVVSHSEIALTADQVGAWLFAPRGDAKGSAITEVPLDETGYAQTGIDDVAIALHNRFATISDRIEASE